MQAILRVKLFNFGSRRDLNRSRKNRKTRVLKLFCRRVVLLFGVIAFTILDAFPSNAAEWSPESIDRSLESFVQRQYPNLSTLLPYVKSIKFSTTQTTEGLMSLAEIKCDSISEARQATYAISVVRDVFALVLDQGAPIKLAAATIETPRGKGTAVFTSMKEITALGHVLSRKPVDQNEWARAEVLAGAGQLESDYNKLVSPPEEFKPVKPKSYSELMDSGRKWYEQHNYDQAIADFSGAIPLESTPTYSAYDSRGRSWFRKGDYEKAIADYTEAIRLNPKYWLYKLRALAFEKNNDFDHAIADYNEALRLHQEEFHSGDWQAISGRAKAWHAKGEFKRAIADYDQLIHDGFDYVKSYREYALRSEMLPSNLMASEDMRF